MITSMLTNEDLLAWFQRLDFSKETCSNINDIRSIGPSRRVGGGKANVAGRYPSRKMGVSIQFESHRVELAGIYEMEHDSRVLEYFDQPPAIKLDYESPAGKRMGVLHTPDFFVIRENEAGWEEWKTEEELRRLCDRNLWFWATFHPKTVAAKFPRLISFNFTKTIMVNRQTINDLLRHELHRRLKQKARWAGSAKALFALRLKYC